MEAGQVIIYMALMMTLGAIPGHVLAVMAGKRAGVARRSRVMATGFMGLSLLMTLLVWALLTFYFMTSDMNLAYVHAHSSTDLEDAYKVSAVWAGKEGSFLLWVLGMQLGLFASRVAFQRSGPGRTAEGRRLLDLVGLVGAILTIIFLSVLASMEPFRPTDDLELLQAPDGMGLQVLLQHPLMALHPMLALIGYGIATVPFGASVAYLLSGNRLWASYSMPYSRAFFLIFSAALTMGGLWAYETLGWGGYWAWDPVETSSLLPWLMGAVVCHSQISQVKRGDSALLGATASFFLLPVMLFATFAARSGLWTSVHAYAASEGDFWAVVSASGFLKGMLGLIVVLCIMGPLLIGRAYMLYYEEGPRRKRAPVSYWMAVKGNALLLGSVLTLMGLLITVFIMLFRVGGQFDPAEFELKLGPLALIVVSGMTLFHLGVRKASPLLPIIVLTVGIALGLIALALYPEEPLGAFSAPFLTVAIVAALQYLWRAPKAKARRQRLHDAGATMVHLGIVLMLLGYSGSTFFAQERTVNMSEGVPVPFEGYDLVLVDMSSDDEHVTLLIEVRTGGTVQAVADPGILIIQGQVRRDVSVVRFLDKDIYFVLEDLDKAVNTDAGARAQVTIKSLPAINALWCGAGLVMAGTAARFSWSTVPELRPFEKKGKKPGPPTSEDE